MYLNYHYHIHLNFMFTKFLLHADTLMCLYNFYSCSDIIQSESTFGMEDAHVSSTLSS